MPRIGIRELRARTSAVLREVREERATYIVTYRGRPVGVLHAIDEAEADTRLADMAEPATTKDAFVRLDDLAKEIEAARRDARTAEQLVSEGRRW